MYCFRQCSAYMPGSYNPGTTGMQPQPFIPPVTWFPGHQAFPSAPSDGSTGPAAGSSLPQVTMPAGGAAMPTGGAMIPTIGTMPTGGTVIPPSAPHVHTSFTIPPSAEQPPQTVTDTLYTPGFLKTQIGKKVRVEFLIGTTSLIDRMGTLLGVGASYILIREAETDDVLLCDIYSIKFVRFYL